MFTENVMKSEESSKFCDEVRTCLRWRFEDIDKFSSVQLVQSGLELNRLAIVHWFSVK